MTKLKDKYAILDRDGTILVEPFDKQVDSVAKFSFKLGVIEALIGLKAEGYKFILITNQDGLGTSSFPTEAYREVNDLMLGVLRSCGIVFEAVCVCPHFAAESCGCRKPSPSLLPLHIREGHFDKASSFLVGDRDCDLELAQTLGIRGLSCATKDWSELMKTRDQSRAWCFERVTSETAVRVRLSNASAKNEIRTTLPFFDHMLDALFRFSGLSVAIEATGDTDVGDHHLIEDVAISVGQVLASRASDKRGIQRFSQWTPMDESLSKISLDLSGRPSFEFVGAFPRDTIGGIDTEMLVHFFKTLAFEMRITVHIELSGLNTHHQCEALFKGFGLALRRALRSTGPGLVPSTKGVL